MKQKISKKKILKCDVGDWLYSDTVKDHFFSPRNLLLDEKNYEAQKCKVEAFSFTHSYADIASEILSIVRNLVKNS